jgi:glycerol-3-phosphate dehydrogenase (NAD(P)+)
MSQRARVLIVGYGEMGHAMESLLGAHHDLTVWQRRAAPVPLASAAAQAQFVLLCVPTPPHAALARELAPAMPATAICLTVAKGLDDEGRTAAEALATELGRRAHGVLCGPMIAEELRAGRPGFAMLGARATDTAGRVQALFASTALQLQPSADLTGLPWCAVLKNVYALLFGMADALGLGDNMRGYLAVAVVEELAALSAALGGERGTAYTLAGLGDLVTTATSRGSHHHELGQKIARGETAQLAGEGLHTIATLARRPRFARSDYPLFELAARCALERAPPRPELMRHIHSRFEKPAS